MSFYSSNSEFTWDLQGFGDDSCILDSLDLAVTPSNQAISRIEMDRLRDNRFIEDPDTLRIIDNLRLHLDMFPELVSDDLTCIMHLWKSKNEPKAMRIMRNLWKSCPTLEQVDWFPSGGYDGLNSNPKTLCRWKFRSKGSATDNIRHLHQVVWDVRWNGCSESTHDPITVLCVGQERERQTHRELRKRSAFSDHCCSAMFN